MVAALTVVGSPIGGMVVGVTEAVASAIRNGIGLARGSHAEQVAANNRHRAQHNGAVSGAYTALDTAQHWRDVDLSRRTQGSTFNVAKAVNDMRDNWQDGNVFLQELTNRLGIMGPRSPRRSARR